MYTDEVLLQLCSAILHSRGQGELAQTHLERRDPSILETPEFRLAAYALPEAISDYKLRVLGSPDWHAYVIDDDAGKAHVFDLHDHPMIRPLFDMLARDAIPETMVRALGMSSAHGAAVSDVFNKGATDTNGMKTMFAPPFLELRSGTLHISKDDK